VGQASVTVDLMADRGELTTIEAVGIAAMRAMQTVPKKQTLIDTTVHITFEAHQGILTVTALAVRSGR
jgi:hypothetical protein